MNKQQFNKREPLRFHRFSRKGYALFSVIGREVLVGVLSVSTLTYAKADGISTHAELAADSLSHDEVKLDEVVVTGTRTPLSLRQAARAVSVITRDDVDRAAAHSLNDVLKLATGVDVRQRGGFGVQTDISINGGTFDQMTILLNGMNISNPQTGHNAGDFPVSIDDIERIEIIEGAASRVLGSSAFSGAVNIVTRKPRQRGATLRVEGGSFGTATVDANVELGSLGAACRHLLSGGYARSDGGTHHSDFRKARAYYRGTLHTPPSTLGIDLDWQVGLSTQDYGANTFYSAKYDNQYEQTRHLLASVGGQVRGLPRGFTVRPMLYGNLFADHYQLMRGEAGAAKGENCHRLFMGGATLDVAYAWVGGTTTIGGDLRKERIWSTAYGRLLDEEQWRRAAWSDRWYDHRADRTNASLYAEHTLVRGPLSLALGLMANHGTNLSPSGGGRRGALCPGIDIAYRPDNHWQLFASWNKALRMPTFTDLYVSNVVQQGDEQLRPERNDTWRVAANWRSRGIDVATRAFFLHGRDMIDWVYATAESSRYEAMNIGRLDNMGCSVDARVDLRTWLGSGNVERVQLGYAFMHQRHSTEQPIHRSLYALEYLRHQLTLQLDHRLFARLKAHWAARWQQRMNGFHPYWKLDGKLTWTQGDWSLHLAADNLTAHRYVDIGGVPQPGLWLMAGGSLRLKW